MEARDMFLLAAQLDELEDVLQMILANPRHSKKTKELVKLESQNRRLAMIVLNQRLRNEVRR